MTDAELIDLLRSTTTPCLRNARDIVKRKRRNGELDKHMRMIEQVLIERGETV